LNDKQTYDGSIICIFKKDFIGQHDGWPIVISLWITKRTKIKNK